MKLKSNSNIHKTLFERILWRDPLSGALLEPIVATRTPGGVPISGAMRIQGTDRGYPIVDSVVRLTPELAEKYSEWLRSYELKPPVLSDKQAAFQQTKTVDSFGWQWTWNSAMRSQEDLRLRVLDKFGMKPEKIADRLVIDAGAGAGDQSAYLLSLGASVVSVDLSDAIDVVARKMRSDPNWVGIQADIMGLPFEADQFDIVYCEGVIQHTQDSVKTVRELCRILRQGGQIMAAHYTRRPAQSQLAKIKRNITLGYYEYLRKRLSRMERFKLLFVTGFIAALSYVPVLGFFMRKTGTALYYDLMPDFKTTWTNTFDYYGNHTYQRFVTPEEFDQYFHDAGGMEIIYSGGGNVVAKKSLAV
jgi:ubiquinone/menaquinone biosynthesis C-methylase UbiE